MRLLSRGDAALLIAAVIALGSLSFALRPQHTVTVAADPATARVDRSAPPAIDRPTALVIGDAYTTGSGLAETSYGCGAAATMGWLCKTAAEAGTGYISGGAANRFPLGPNSGMSTSFGERISRFANTYAPDVVLLDGGRNDLFAPPSARFEVMASAIAQAHQVWPNARIVFVIPRFLSRPDDDLDINDKAVDKLRNASGVDDLVVVDPVAAFTDRDTAGLISRDGTNPNAEGERALAAALAESLRRNGFARVT